MKSESRIAIVSVLLFCVASHAWANDWIAAGADNLWSNPDNWSQGVAPLNATSNPTFGWDDLNGPFYPLTPDTSDDGPLENNNALLKTDDVTILIDDSVTATAYGVRIGFDGDSNTLEITGGSLQVGGVPPGQTDPEGWHLDVGRGINRSGNPDSLATLRMTGGDVETNGFLIPESFVDDSQPDPYDTAGVNGEVLMSGGTITARWMNVGQFTGNGSVELSGDAVINLWPSVASNRNNGGHFEMKRNWFIDGQPAATVSDASLDIRDDAVINIFGARNEFTMTPNQSEIDRMQAYVDDGWLTANNGTAEPLFTLQECPDDGTFDDICVGGMMITITAPVQESPGDFNLDGSWDCADIGALVGEIVAGTNNADFDMNGDGVVNVSDITDATSGWLTVGGENNADVTGGNPFFAGDLNLDGDVGSSDLGLLLNNFGDMSGAAYCGGDINADSNVDSSDLGLLLNNFGGSAATLAAVAVPEPTSGLIWFSALGVFALRRRHRR